jgi:hypothetical protein
LYVPFPSDPLDYKRWIDNFEEVLHWLCEERDFVFDSCSVWGCPYETIDDFMLVITSGFGFLDDIMMQEQKDRMIGIRSQYQITVSLPRSGTA